MAQKDTIVARIDRDFHEVIEEAGRVRAKALGVSRISFGKMMEWVYSLLPKEKYDQLFRVFQQFTGKVKEVILEPDLNGDVDKIFSQFLAIISGSMENPKKLKSYIADLEQLIDKKADDFSTKKKRGRKDGKKKKR